MTQKSRKMLVIVRFEVWIWFYNKTRCNWSIVLPLVLLIILNLYKMIDLTVKRFENIKHDNF